MPSHPQTLHLTFDDGPDPIWTPAILRRLRRHRVHASFFVLGERVVRDPWLLGLVVADGHEIGLHGHRHLDHAAVPSGEIADDTRRALAVLGGLGVRPRRWRLPWGRSGPVTASLATEFGLELVPWDHDTHDWRGDGWAEQPAAVRAGVVSGGIVLLHDGLGPGATRTGCENTLELIDALVEHGGTPRCLTANGPHA